MKAAAPYASPSRHLMCSIHGKHVAQERRLQNDLMGALAAAGASVVGISKWEFHPHGLSMAILLSESHCSLHSWPERQAALVDYFSCSPRAAVQYTAFMQHLKERGYEVENVSICRRSLEVEPVA